MILFENYVFARRNAHPQLCEVGAAEKISLTFSQLLRAKNLGVFELQWSSLAAAESGFIGEKALVNTPSIFSGCVQK